MPHEYSKGEHYCSSCGDWHNQQELTINRNGALICKNKHTKVRNKPEDSHGGRK